MDAVLAVIKTVGAILLPVFLLGNCTGGCIATKIHSSYCDAFGYEGTGATPIHHVEGWEPRVLEK